MAVISLIGETKQWFKARIGVDVPETPLTGSFCAQAIRAPAPMVILDATHDERFANSPLVTGPPHIRFYAGAQIRDRRGIVLGTLCIFAPVPAAGFSDHDRERLVSLAGIVSSEMEMRRQTLRAIRHAAEKDLLIREAHHQVANSLQMIVDVVELQAAQASGRDVGRALRGAARRVMAIGEVHQQLRRQGPSDDLNARDYLGRLTRRLWMGIAPDHTSRDLTLDVPPDLRLSPELLARIGLSATELIINALQSGEGRVHVTLKSSPGVISLVTAVEGGGIAGRVREGLGFALIRMLAGEDSIAIDPDDPTGVIVRFTARQT